MTDATVPLVFAGAVAKDPGPRMLAVYRHCSAFTDNFHVITSMTVFCERSDLPATDNQGWSGLISTSIKARNQSLREGFVGLPGCVVSPEAMVMREHHRRHVEVQEHV